MHCISNRDLIEKCAVLLGMIEAGTHPRPNCGICANLEAIAGTGNSRLLNNFFADTGRDMTYPVETAMSPHLNEDQIEDLYIDNGLSGLLWKGDAREARIALLNEFIEWLEENADDHD